ncbi:hypothetical protein [uncultured Amnibacterium sp.]|uniref:hypothetical protein n=1 Tax=uncultured Amnibacterium sp. TaxID=1631851 RepID=UPI0035C9A7E5
MDRAGVGTASVPDGRRSVRSVRAARGVLASTVAVLAACAGHVAAGGAMPAPALLTAVLVLSWLPGVALIGVAVRLWRQAAVIVVAEAMLHGVLALQRGAGAAPMRPLPSADPVGGVGMAGMGAGHAAGSASAAAAQVVGAASMSHTVAMPAWMWLAHAAAAAVTVLLWRRGETDVARVLAMAGRGLGRLLRVPGPVRLAAPVAALPPVAHRLGRVIEAIRTAHPHRGPPLAV